MSAFIRKPLLAGLLVLLSGAAFTQPAPASHAPRKLLMWKAVSGKNVEYFIGSIHVGTPDMYPLPKVMTDAFNRSKVLVEELDLGKVNQGDVLQFVQANGMYTDGDNLWNHLDKATADKAKKYFEKFGMPEQAVGMFKPWLASLMASVAPMMKQGMKGDLGIDMHFSALAKEKHEPIVGAETLNFQMKMLGSLPQDLAIAYLQYQVDQGAKDEGDSINIMQLWKAGDADALDLVMNYVPVNLEPMMNTILYNRNPHMADVAEKYLKSGGPCFFVVGAGHLVGSRGVIAILQKRGYEIYQLSAN